MSQTTLSQAQIDALKTTLRARWNAGLAAAPNDWQKIAKLIASSSKSTTYEWLSQFPAFREWVGPRQHKRMKEHAYSVINRSFESTVDVPRTDIEDDNIGQYGTLAESSGHAAIDLKNALVFQAISTGFGSGVESLCYDGQPFFDTDHPVAANEDGSGAVTSVSNVQAGSGQPWVLFCTKRAPSALYLQERMAPHFDAKTSAATSDSVFENDMYSFGGRWRGEVAYGFWQCAFGSKAELNEENFNAAFMAITKFEGDGRRPLGLIPDLLVVGPDNLAAAEKLLKAVTKENGASNTNYGKTDLFMSPWIRNPVSP
jgi:phage major head subunit gpT-like protein